MRVQRTPWWYYVLAVIIGFAGGVALVSIDDITGLTLVGAPWIVPAILLLFGLIILVLALQIHRYANTDPAKRHGFIDPTRAAYTLVLAKALGVAGAALTGWYAGQIVMSLAHSEAPFYHQVIVECAITGGVCLADMIIGIISEWLCQLPPSEGPENPKMTELKRRRNLAQQANQRISSSQSDSFIQERQ